MRKTYLLFLCLCVSACNEMSFNKKKETSKTDTIYLSTNINKSKYDSLLLSYKSIEYQLNQKDSNNKKQGFWIEEEKTLLTESYYLDDLKQGMYKSYLRTTGHLAYIGFYKQDIPTETWYYFDEYSRHYMTNKIIVYEESNQELFKGTYLNLPFKSEIILYHKNGFKSAEGIALYEDVEMDFFKTGTWNYYDTLGNLIKSENYENIRISE